MPDKSLLTYESLADEIIQIFSQIVKEKKQITSKTLATMFENNKKITNIISPQKSETPYKEDTQNNQDNEDVKKKLKEAYKKLDEQETEANKKHDLLTGLIRTITIAAKTEEESKINELLQEVNEGLKNKENINLLEFIEINSKKLKNEILRMDQEKDNTLAIKKKTPQEEEIKKKSFFAGLFKKDKSPKQIQEVIEPESGNKTIKELLIAITLRLQLEKAEEINKKVKDLTAFIEKEHLITSISKIKFEICELIEAFKGRLDDERSNLFEVMREIATKLIDTEQELLNAFSNTQNKSNLSNQNFHDIFTNEMNGIENSFNQGDSIDGIRNIVFNKLTNIRKSLQEKKAQDQKLNEESITYINRIQEDIKKNRNEIQKVQDMTDRDILTGLYNRGAFQRRLNEDYKEFKEKNNNSTIITLDIDNLKKINNNYGYDNGDRILQAVAKVISDNLSEKYFFARYGGGQFVLILPEVTIELGKKISDRIRQHVTNIDFSYLGEKVEVTVSLGLTSFQEKQTSIQIFQKANEAMYQAKKNGKNQLAIIQ